MTDFIIDEVTASAALLLDKMIVLYLRIFYDFEKDGSLHKLKLPISV